MTLIKMLSAPTVLIVGALLTSACMAPESKREKLAAPVGTYHQHLISPAIGTLWQVPDRLDAEQLIQQLDDAGIRTAAVLSVAHAYGDDRRQIPDEYAQVRAENDWTQQQVARWPQRLVGFCGVSPLKSYALEELERCAKLPNMRGLKLHLGNSGVELRKPEHVERLGAIFEAAQAHKLSIAIHMKTRTGLPYGREDATIFLNKVVSRAPNTPIQIAHLAGAGPGYQDFIDDALSVFVAAIQARDPHTRNLFFDVTTVATRETTAENGALIARRIRELGPNRILFGADHSLSGNPAPGEAWRIFRTMIPLTPAELQTIAANVPSYMQGATRR
ncbi:MAG TPA: amidohydrolase family protein [Steroidobacteraceae bacterium]|nr:amidohydrolase family protein [Steroidobacteraceae bacterium]